MLDADLAEVYQVETRALVQAVKRNAGRFPEDFTFQLSPEEAEAVRSQFVIASKRNIRYQPYAFTEHGALMLASVLKSKRAVRMSIQSSGCLYSSANSWPTTKTWPPEWKSWKLPKRATSILALVVEEIKKLKAPKPAPPKRPIGFRT